MILLNEGKIRFRHPVILKRPLCVRKPCTIVHVFLVGLMPIEHGALLRLELTIEEFYWIFAT